MKTNRTHALLLLALVWAADAQAQSGPPSSVAFQSTRDGGNNIYVMNADGSDQRFRTTGTFTNQRADISPDGSRIVFASNRPAGGNHLEIFVMNADGGDIRPLTNTPSSSTNTWPRWSPDGEWIAFQSNVSGTFHIYAVRPDGSDLHGITVADVGHPNQFPAWSPDGTRLAVRRDSDIYVIDLTGLTAPVRLTTAGPVNQMPSWSPDGTQIAFMSTREPGNYPSVFLMNADGSNQVNLTPKLDAGTNTWSSRAPAWSPNGSYIYFTGVRPGTSSEQIYVMRADGSDQRSLTMAGVNAEATVRRVRPPAITSITATPDVLWPPTNQTVSVSVNVAVSDDSDPVPECRITAVESNEPITGIGWQITGSLTVDLLAQRSGAGIGRVYTLTVTCTNSSDLGSSATVSVRVPHDRRR